MPATPLFCVCWDCLHPICAHQAPAGQRAASQVWMLVSVTFPKYFLFVSLTILVVVRTQRPGIGKFLKINFKILGNKLFVEFGTLPVFLKLNYKRKL